MNAQNKMSHIPKFRMMVQKPISEFLENDQTSYSIQDMISPTLVSIQESDCNCEDIAAELAHQLMWHYKHHISLTQRYKLLTILFPICKKFVDVLYYSYHECKACGNTGWWCRGCGGSDKVDAMKNAGFSDPDAIYEYQFGSCDEPLVPCYLCNKDGSRECDENYETDSEFWKEFMIENE